MICLHDHLYVCSHSFWAGRGRAPSNSCQSCKGGDLSLSLMQFGNLLYFFKCLPHMTSYCSSNFYLPKNWSVGSLGEKYHTRRAFQLPYISSTTCPSGWCIDTKLKFLWAYECPGLCHYFITLVMKSQCGVSGWMEYDPTLGEISTLIFIH